MTFKNKMKTELVCKLATPEPYQIDKEKGIKKMAITSHHACGNAPHFKKSLLAVILAALYSAGAQAQQEPAETVAKEDKAAEVEIIEVRAQATGTLVRGSTPVGTNVIGFSEKDVEVIGVPDSNELLAQIPQVSSTFNSRPTMATDIGQGMPMPKLRDIGTGGGSTTLLLLNGMRMPGSGIIQTVPNAAAIPPSAIGNVEIVLDGGSSIYGSDAIAGVVNFITTDKFDGTEVSIEGGTGDSFSAATYNLTTGTDWDSGSAVFSLYHARNDSVYGQDRSFISGDTSAMGGADYRTSQCAAGNIVANGINYKMDTGSQGTNFCDPNDGITYVPAEDKTTFYVSAIQEVSENALLDVVAYYSRWNVGITGDATNGLTDTGVTGTITSANPFFSPVAGESSQQVSFDFSPVNGPGAQNGSEFDAFAFIPELTIDLPDDWRLKAAYGFGHATTFGYERGVNQAALADALASTSSTSALNPYDLTATAPSVLNSILDYYGTYGDATQSHHQLRMTLDGTAFTLPAGDVLTAFGAEYFSQDYEVAFGGGAANALQLVNTEADRNVKSVFTEVVVPVLDSEVGSVDFTASLRYDKYNDVGDTTNPKVGVDYAPTDNLRLRAQWGTSFQAPSLADSGAAVDTRAIVNPVSPWRAGDSPDSDFNRGTILLAGGSDGMKPEESESHSIGFDWEPEFADKLNISMTYFNVDYSSAINLAPFWTPSVYFNTPGYAAYYTLNPTLEQVQAATAGFRIDGMPVEALFQDGNTPYMLADARRYNMTATKLSGLDFDINKAWGTDFGRVTAGVAGSYTLDRKVQPVQGSPYEDELNTDTRGRYNAVAFAGIQVDEFTGNLRILHSDGWENASASLDSLTTVNLFASYGLGQVANFEDVLITFNVDNVLDEEPPFFNDPNGFLTGSVLGRVFYLGVKVRM